MRGTKHIMIYINIFLYNIFLEATLWLFSALYEIHSDICGAHVTLRYPAHFQPYNALDYQWYIDQIWQFMDQFQRIWTVLSETLSTGSLDWTYGLLDPVNCYYFLRRTGPKNWSIPIGPCSSHFVPHMLKF